MSVLPLSRTMTVDEPHLIKRYAKAMTSFGLDMPKLKSFEIDMIGFSWEIAKALKDEDYLDPHKANRRFIILSPEQAELSVVHSSFSNTRDLMLEFYESNAREIHALTIKDVVFGEIEDSVFQIDHIDDLLSIEQVEFKISTPKGLPAKTAELKSKIERLLKEPDAWRDDKMLKEMVILAKATGDIRDNELLPAETVFRHETYWANHFGGIYVFNDEQQVTIICDPSARGFRKSRPWQVSYLDINDHHNIYKFLEQSGRLDPPRGSWIERSGLLELRMNMVVPWLMSKQGDKLPTSFNNVAAMKKWVRENNDVVEEDNTLPLLSWVQDQVKNWSNIDMREVDADERFILCRANPDHEDFRLVNRLISDFLPFDFVTRYEFNRPNFIRDFDSWSKPYAKFVEEALANTYLKDGKQMRDRLYT